MNLSVCGAFFRIVLSDIDRKESRGFVEAYLPGESLGLKLDPDRPGGGIRLKIGMDDPGNSQGVVLDYAVFGAKTVI